MIEQLQDDDWAEVFGEDTPYDEDHWRCVGRLKDGRWFYSLDATLLTEVSRMRLLQWLYNLLPVTRGEFMSTVSDIQAAIAAEKADVQAKLQALKDHIASMESVSAEDKAAIISAIENISEPDAV